MRLLLLCVDEAVSMQAQGRQTYERTAKSRRSFVGASVAKFSSRAPRRASRRYSVPMIAGEKAPDFTLYDHTGRPRTLSALLADGPVVLFFFPIASSPICTAQACHFRDRSTEFARVGAQRVGKGSRRTAACFSP